MKDNSYLEISQRHPYKSWIWRKAIDQVTEIKRASNWLKKTTLSGKLCKWICTY